MTQSALRLSLALGLAAATLALAAAEMKWPIHDRTRPSRGW